MEIGHPPPQLLDLCRCQLLVDCIGLTVARSIGGCAPLNRRARSSSPPNASGEVVLFSHTPVVALFVELEFGDGIG